MRVLRKFHLRIRVNIFEVRIADTEAGKRFTSFMIHYSLVVIIYFILMKLRFIGL